MRVCILGAGGLGSIIGGHLARGGADVTLIARPAHAEAVNKSGLKLTGIHGEHQITGIKGVANADQAEGDFDYLFLGVKSKDTKTILQENASLKGRVATACSFQNNVVKEKDLSDFFGPEHVIGFSTIEAGHLEAPGHAVHNFSIPNASYFGEMDGTITPRVEAIVEAFNNASMPAKAMTNMPQVIWEKVCQIANAASWSVSTLAGNPELAMGEGMCIQEGAEHYVQVAREFISVLKALGYPPQNFFAPVSQLKELDSGSFEDAVQTVVTIGKGMLKQGFKSRPSMMMDVIRGRKTEVDHTILPFIEKADELGIEVPTLRAVYRIIKVLDYYLK